MIPSNLLAVPYVHIPTSYASTSAKLAWGEVWQSPPNKNTKDHPPHAGLSCSKTNGKIYSWGSKVISAAIIDANLFFLFRRSSTLAKYNETPAENFEKFMLPTTYIDIPAQRNAQSLLWWKSWGLMLENAVHGTFWVVELIYQLKKMKKMWCGRWAHHVSCLFLVHASCLFTRCWKANDFFSLEGKPEWSQVFLTAKKKK